MSTEVGSGTLRYSGPEAKRRLRAWDVERDGSINITPTHMVAKTAVLADRRRWLPHWAGRGMKMLCAPFLITRWLLRRVNDFNVRTLARRRFEDWP